MLRGPSILCVGLVLSLLPGCHLIFPYPEPVGAADSGSSDGVGADFKGSRKDRGGPKVPDLGPGRLDGGGPPKPDRGPTPIKDKGVPPKPDQGVPPKPDQGGPPKPDQGVPPKPDKGTPPVPDKGTPPKPDAKPYPDQGKLKPDAAPKPTWTPVSHGKTTQDLNAVWGTSASMVWAAGEGGVTLRFDGSHWVLTTMYSYYDYFGGWTDGAVHHFVGHAVYGDGEAWAWYKSGSWNNQHQTKTYRRLRAVHGGGGSFLVAVGDDSLVYKLASSSWQLVNLVGGVSEDFRGVYMDTAASAYIVSEGGVVLRWTPTGTTMQTTISGSPELTAVWANPAGGVLVTSEKGHIYAVSANGNVSQAFSHATTEWNDIKGNAAGVLYAVGEKGNNGRIVSCVGGKWSSVDNILGYSNGPRRLNAVYVAGGGEVFAVGDQGLVLRGP